MEHLGQSELYHNHRSKRACALSYKQYANRTVRLQTCNKAENFSSFEVIAPNSLFKEYAQGILKTALKCAVIILSEQ